MIFHILKMFFQIALQQMKTGPKVARDAIGSLVEILKQKLYDTYMVREYIWGMYHPLIKLGRDVERDPRKKYPYEKFGMLVGRNYSNNGKATIYSGLESKGYLGELLKWDDKENLNLWQPGSDCDKPR